MNKVKLSKTMSYILRHRPDQFGIEVDRQGFVELEELQEALERQFNQRITVADIRDVVENSQKRRFEIKDHKIRALYGHSKVRVDKESKKPPKFLYHGSTEKALKDILLEGIKPMNRQYVHLSLDIKTALEVGSRRTSKPVLLKINTVCVRKAGHQFYQGNEFTWLTDHVPATCLEEIDIY